MKKWLFVAVLALLAGAAMAEESFVNGQKSETARAVNGTFVGGATADSTPYVLPIATGGTALSVSEYAKDRDLALDDDSPILSTSLTAIGAADSTAILDVSGYALTGLAISASGGCRLFVQVRYCRDGVQDSTHTFPIVLARQDSIGVGNVVDMFTGSTTVARGTEFEVRLTTLGTYGQTRRVLVPLTRLMEVPRLSHISVRVRLALADDVTNPKVVQVYAVGSALR